MSSLPPPANNQPPLSLEQRLTQNLLRFFAVLSGLAVLALALGALSKREDVTGIGTYLAAVGVFVFAIAILGAILYVLIVRLLKSLDDEGPPRFERDWGVLGEGVQGWEISRSLTYSVLVLFVAGLLAMLVSQFLQSQFQKKTDEQTTTTDSADSGKSGAQSGKDSASGKDSQSGEDASSDKDTPSEKDAQSDKDKQDNKGQPSKGDDKGSGATPTTTKDSGKASDTAPKEAPPRPPPSDSGKSPTNTKAGNDTGTK